MLRSGYRSSLRYGDGGGPTCPIGVMNLDEGGTDVEKSFQCHCMMQTFLFILSYLHKVVEYQLEECYAE